MKSDALFQLGMGPVVLDATQTEELSSLRPGMARNAGLHGSAGQPRVADRRKGNSAKALMPST